MCVGEGGLFGRFVFCFFFPFDEQKGERGAVMLLLSMQMHVKKLAIAGIKCVQTCNAWRRRFCANRRADVRHA